MNMDTAMLVLMSEIGFVLTIVFIIVFIYIFKRAQRDEKITHKLVQQFKDESPDRRKSLLLLLKLSFQMSDADAEKKLHELMSKEKSLYSHILKAFSGEDRSGIKNLNEDIQSLINAYQSLTVVRGLNEYSTPGCDDNLKILNEELLNLRKENETAIRERDNLKKDLNSALDSIQKLQIEYAQMYGETAKKPDE